MEASEDEVTARVGQEHHKASSHFIPQRMKLGTHFIPSRASIEKQITRTTKYVRLLNDVGQRRDHAQSIFQVSSDGKQSGGQEKEWIIHSASHSFRMVISFHSFENDQLAGVGYTLLRSADPQMYGDLSPRKTTPTDIYLRCASATQDSISI